MLFSLYCIDKPDSLALRMERRPDHVAFLEARADQIVYGGPLLSDAAEPSPLGSLLIIDVTDRAAAEAFSTADPYSKAGLFETVTIRATRQVFPKVK